MKSESEYRYRDLVDDDVIERRDEVAQVGDPTLFAGPGAWIGTRVKDLPQVMRLTRWRRPLNDMEEN